MRVFPQRLLKDFARSGVWSICSCLVKPFLKPFSIACFCGAVKMSISGFVQAGGKSQRMGENKALMKLGGRALIEHALDALAPLGVSSLQMPMTAERVWRGIQQAQGLGVGLRAEGSRLKA